MCSDRLDPTAKGPDRQPIIFWTIKKNDQRGVRQLLDDGASLETRGFGGRTPALAAAIVESWVMCLMLLRRGADPWASDQSGFTIAQRAAASRLINPEAEEYAALQEVRGFLKERGLYDRIYQTDEVKALRAAGQWPPPEARLQRPPSR